MDTNSGNKKIWVIVGIIVIVALAWWMLSKQQVGAPTVSDTTASDQDAGGTANISGELNGLQDADLNAEFQDVNSDTSQL